MFSYGPLNKTLKEKGMTLNNLETRRGGVLHEKTVYRINKGKSVTIETLAKACVFLNVPIEDVVEVIRD